MLVKVHRQSSLIMRCSSLLRLQRLLLFMKEEAGLEIVFDWLISYWQRWNVGRGTVTHRIKHGGMALKLQSRVLLAVLL